MSSRSREISWTLALALVRSVGSRDRLARELRMAFERLGPGFVKLGQLISVRPDLFWPEIVFEMEALQDSVPALPAKEIRDVIGREFGRSADEVFSAFDDEPVASASIAQVHRAVLADEYRPVVGPVLPAGTVLAVKVVRPGVEDAIRADVAAARPLARWLQGSRRFGRYSPVGLLDELEASLRSECDLRCEAGVADRFGYDFRDDDLMLVPRVVWPLTTRRVLTTEFVDGWRLSELDAVHRAGIDGRALAVHGATVFLRQVLELGRFHADLHPANLFVTPDGRICYLDFGITGTTTPAQRLAIAQVLAATVYGDAERAVRYSAKLGLVLPAGREAAIRDRIAELMRETLRATPRDIRGYAMGFLRILDSEGVAVPLGYGLLVKALVTVEGVARALYPDIDIAEAAGPYATRVVARWALHPARIAQRGPAALRAALRELAG